MSDASVDAHAATQTAIRVAVPAVERRERAYYLVLLEGAESGRRIALDAASVTIGREASQHVVLPDPDISRMHARLSIQLDQVVVEDLGSTNGTFVDGHRIAGPVVLSEGSLLGLGQHLLKLERRSKREVEHAEQMRRDIVRACHYVRSLLPEPLTDGAIRTDWLFEPSAQLGGDAFGYDQLDADTFLIYLFDVSGHGAGAAMHSVSVLNVLRQRALPEADLRDPARALACLNGMFQMDRHDGMVFTMWYAVYDAVRRTLRYACGGHHPAYLVTDGAEGRRATALKTRGLVVGASPDVRYRCDETIVAAGSRLYVFSDGVFEFVTPDHRQWCLSDFTSLLLDDGPAPQGVPESLRLRGAIRAAARRGPLDDDVALLIVTFA